ncbi:hypothetical protein MKEN_00449300 [Mycena kentingensis (nom. inval.)]|nr:hypothetical protein MKEN_00449300 [Mycena kentingensis (nom. inval.)]
MNDDTSPPEQYYVPEPGAFAVLRIDPEASLEYLDDPVTVAAAKQIPFQDYLVYVSNSTRIWIPWGRPGPVYRGLNVHPHCPRIPKGHPESRQPMSPNLPLPWSYCYLTPFLDTEVRFRNILGNEPPRYYLTVKEQVRVRMVLMADWDRRQQAAIDRAKNLGLWTRPPRHPVDDAGTVAPDAYACQPAVDAATDAAPVAQTLVPASTTISNAALVPRPDSDPTHDYASSSSASTTYDDSDVDSDSGADTLDRDPDAFIAATLLEQLARQPPPDMITVMITHNLSTLELPPNPKYYFEEAAQLERQVPLLPPLRQLSGIEE